MGEKGWGIWKEEESNAEGRVGKRTWRRKGQEDVEDEGGRVMVDAGRE